MNQNISQLSQAGQELIALSINFLFSGNMYPISVKISPSLVFSQPYCEGNIHYKMLLKVTLASGIYGHIKWLSMFIVCRGT